MKSLLEREKSLDLKHQKWFRNISEGEITIREQLYKLTMTESKRDFVYEGDTAVNTKAFYINNDRKINIK